MRAALKPTLVGLGVLSGVIVPCVLLGLLGFYLWGDGGVLLGFAPPMAAFILFIAFLIGEDLVK